MFAKLGELFFTGQIKLGDKGEFLLFGKRAVILYFDILEGMLEFLEDSFGKEKGGEIAYKLSKAGAIKYITHVISKLGYTGEKAIVAAGELASIAGWGKITVTDFDSRTKTAKITVEHCPFVHEGVTSNKPICHFSRGMFAGAATAIWEEDIDSEEISCGAVTGKDSCIFLLRPSGGYKT